MPKGDRTHNHDDAYAAIEHDHEAVNANIQTLAEGINADRAAIAALETRIAALEAAPPPPDPEPPPADKIVVPNPIPPGFMEAGKWYVINGRSGMTLDVTGLDGATLEFAGEFDGQGASRAIIGQAADLTILGGEFHNYALPAQTDTAIDLRDCTAAIVIGTVVRDISNGNGIRPGDDTRLEDVEAYNCGNCGINSTGRRVQLVRVRSHDNFTRAANYGNSGGGMKVLMGSGIATDCEFNDNGNRGIWTDRHVGGMPDGTPLPEGGWSFINCTATGNATMGIQIELSQQVLVDGGVYENNLQHPNLDGVVPFGAFQAQVLLVNSFDTEVHNVQATGTHHALTVATQNRTGAWGKENYWTHDVTVTDNTISEPVYQTHNHTQPITDIVVEPNTVV